MKIRPLVVTVGALTAVILVANPVSAYAPCYDYGTRDVPAGAIAGGARFASVVDYQPIGKSTNGGSLSACSTGVP